MTPFLICEFGKPTISNLVKECYGSAFPDIYEKKQVHYLTRYLSDLKAQCVLLEKEYVDKDYLDDYTKFYAHRFGNQGHRCARLHFFSEKYTHTEFEGFLAKNSATEELKKSYLGFVVIKPLPKTFIGKTCLRLYEAFEKQAATRTILKRSYDANLFGLDLSVDSIAFQEQDKVVSACATTSIWCALQALSWIGVRNISSCGDITANAINFIDGSSNSFPRAELTNKQMLRALDAEGLRHHVHSLTTSVRDDAKTIIEIYLKSKLPLILGTDVYSLDGKSATRLAGHATTILGCDFASEDQCLYVHDDRFGPFARARFVELSSYEFGSGTDRLQQKWGLVLQEKDDIGNWKAPAELLVPNVLIGMTHKKVRIPLDLVLGTCERIRAIHDKGVAAFRKSQPESAPAEQSQSPISFDIQLREVSEVKREIHISSLNADPELDEEQSVAWERRYANQKIAALTKSMARFQWVAAFNLEKKPAFTIFIDATDIPQGDAVGEIYENSPTNMAAILDIIKVVALDKPKEPADEKSFIDSFLRRLDPVNTGLEHHLNSCYGVPGAPVSLKPEELERSDVRENQTVCRFYEAIEETLDERFSKLLREEDPYLIWVIDFEGTLLVGQEIDKMGHPTLTGFKPARIAGELRKVGAGWVLNAKSGRYSASYENSDALLENALRRFKAIFPASREELSFQPRQAMDK